MLQKLYFKMSPSTTKSHVYQNLGKLAQKRRKLVKLIELRKMRGKEGKKVMLISDY
jgi:hypothetical protein